MSLMLRALLCVSGLVACSQTVPKAAEGPLDAGTRQSTSSKGSIVQPEAPESSVLTSVNASASPTGPSSNAPPQRPAGGARTTSTETHDENDPALQQRIRQAAMADSLF